eukprot:6055244-Pyramimonas_sp.AAC.1
MQLGPARLYSDGEGALNGDTAKAVLQTRGAELRIRARGQRARPLRPEMVCDDAYFTSWRLNLT